MVFETINNWTARNGKIKQEKTNITLTNWEYKTNVIILII